MARSAKDIARCKERYVSSSSEIKTGKKVDCQGNEQIIRAIANATSFDIEELLQAFEVEKNACPLLKKVWDAAAQSLKYAKHEAFKQEGVPDCLQIALIAYVMNGFYSKFNATTRNIKSRSEVNKYPYKIYFKLLLLAIIKVRGVPPSALADMKVYRGVDVKLNVGEFVFFQHFLSTSRNEETAKDFAGAGTLFVIENMVYSGIKKGLLLGLNGVCPNMINLDHIQPLVNLRQENETLIWPYEAFKVTKIVKSDSGPDYIYLTPT